ncbi:hypothetical protein IEO21_04860 [Rhodonia placenta]|uniref:Isochorismatase-like domain-containing protein n=1 Tax=Rhodonia placenta TaxID=104341 RepID=A0A8H7P3H0_9APHY|nr:hypothetical protein IEO21_04860 [Postia placenta]
MTIRPHVTSPIEYGDAASFWVEYPSGLVDLTRHAHLPLGAQDTGEVQIPPLQTSTQLEIPVDGERVVRISKERSAIVIIDMQKNWGLTEHELHTIPPALVRSFMKNGRGGFGSQLPGTFGRLLMRGEYNSDLYGPLQGLYEEGKKEGTDVWVHKNRMSGIWGYQTALDLYLEENGITTLFFAGVNADQASTV